MKRDETRRVFALIGVLGVTVLALLMLVNVVGAAPYAYLTGHGGDKVAILDTSTKQVVTSIPVGEKPGAIAITPDGSKMYVGNSVGSYTQSDTVSVIDTSTNKVRTNITVGNGIQNIAVTPDGSKVYVTNWYDDNVSVIDTVSDTLIASIKVIDAPNGIVITGNKAYVANSFSEPGAVSVIDTTTNSVIDTIILDKYYPFAIAASPDGKNVYVVSMMSSSVSVINTSTDTVTANITVNVGDCSPTLTVSPDGSKVYVTTDSFCMIYVIDTVTNTVISSISIEDNPCGVVFNPDGTKLYVPTYRGIDVIDPATNSIIDTIPVGCNRMAFKENSSTLGPVYPFANFSTNVSKGYVPLTVQFIDLSENAISVKWDFNGDGVSDSEDRNPINTFTVPGTYTVKLTASNENGTGSKLATISVLGHPVLPVANFSANVSEGYAPLIVQFNDSSENATSVNWHFGDGSISEARNPVHEFATIGTYTVNLIARNENGTDSTSSTINVTEKPLLPVANFSSNVTQGYVPFFVKLTDLSQHATSWNWDFGDGAYSTVRNPVYVYNKAGNYTVNLTVSNANGTDSKFATITALPVFPVAAFSASPTTGQAPLAVAFTDDSIGSPTSWTWSFGDGAHSQAKNPVYTYIEDGKYNVSLTVTNAVGTNTTIKPNCIIISSLPLPVASFTSNVTSGIAPLNVSFNDTSTNIPTVWKWTFGDGTNSTVQNPTHKYSKVGSYTVKLTVTNTAGNNTTAKANYIKVTAVTKPVSNFTSNVTSGYVPLNVSFTDKSTGTPTAWKWNFGDGTNSTVRSPTHKYLKAGNYTVVFTVSNAAGNNTTTKTNYIKVKAVTKPVAAFSGSPTSGNVPLKVKFTDKSTGSPTSWSWSFGDGAYSTVKNPIYTYNEAGKYTVSLTVKNAAGTNTKTVTNYITVKPAPVKPVAAFSASPTSGKPPLKVQFTDKSTNSPTSWKWSFGDGKSSTQKNPSHTYSKAGKYTVALIATNVAGSSTLKKSNYINVVTVTKPVAAFSASPTSGKHPLNVKFTDKSTGSPTSWSWNFGDKNTSTVHNPAHKYTKAGKYTVKLTVKNAAGSSSKTMVITVK